MANTEEILEKTNLVELISEYVPLEKRGKNHQGLCPFHDEKTPSFSVSEDKQLYHCFGCKASGNAITFLKDYKNMSSKEALKHLAERAGLEYTVQMDPNGRLYDALKAAKDTYHVLLLNSTHGDAAMAYLAARNIDLETIKTFELGVSLAQRDHLKKALLASHFLESELSDATLVSGTSPSHDFFHERLMIPLADETGRVVGFSGRTLKDAEPKYVNSAEGKIFQKGRIVFGFHQAKKAIKEKNRVLLTEGYFDVFKAHQHGFTETVALMGTSLSDAAIKLIRSVTDQIVLVLDGDAPGKAAASKLLEQLKDAHVRVVDFEHDDDLDSFLEAKGSAALDQKITQADDRLAFHFKQLKATYDLTKIGEFESFKQRFYPLLKVASVTEQAYYIKALAAASSIQEAVLNQDFYGAKKPVIKALAAHTIIDKYHKAEIQMLHYFLKDEHYTRWFRREFADIMYIDKTVRDIQFEIFEHYDLNPVSCLVVELFVESLSPVQQTFIKTHIDMVHYPFNAEEFEDLLRVMHQYQTKLTHIRLQDDLKHAKTIEDKMAIKQQMDRLKKELSHGI